MFNLIKSTYLCLDNFYDNTKNRMVFSEDYGSGIEQEGIIRKPNLKKYIEEVGVNPLLNSILKTKDFRGEDFIVYCDKYSLPYLLNIWFQIHFPEHSLEDLKELVRLFTSNERMVNVEFSQINGSLSQEGVEIYNNDLNEIEEMDLSEIFDFTKTLEIEQTIINQFKEELPIEWVMLIRYMVNLDDKTTERFNHRIKQMLKNNFYKTAYSEACFKLRQCLPRINKLGLGYTYDPTDVASYYALLEDNYIGLLLDKNTPREKVFKKMDEPAFINLIESIVQNDNTEEGNIDNSHFSRDGFTFSSIIRSIRKTKMNMLFHEKNVYWERINHKVVSCLVDTVKGNGSDYKLDFIKGYKP